SLSVSSSRFSPVSRWMIRIVADSTAAPDASRTVPAMVASSCALTGRAPRRDAARISAAMKEDPASGANFLRVFISFSSLRSFYRCGLGWLLGLVSLLEQLGLTADGIYQQACREGGQQQQIGRSTEKGRIWRANSCERLLVIAN